MQQTGSRLELIGVCARPRPLVKEINQKRLKKYKRGRVYLSARLLLAVNKKWGSLGLALTQPIFCSLKPYHLGFFLAPFSSLRSRWVRPPSVSEIHISCPESGRSMDDMST